MAGITCVVALLVGFASAANTYPKLGGLGMVANDEGYDIGSFKPKECGNGCTIVGPGGLDLSACTAKCEAKPKCKSFAHCTGNPKAKFMRCYMKDKDFSVKPHVTNDCTTYKMTVDGPQALAGLNKVAVDEGNGFSAYKPDCDDSPGCVKTKDAETTLDFCREKCRDTKGCFSFAHCTGNKKADFQRCYTKDKDFGVQKHSTSDCTTYFKQSDSTSRLYGMLPKIGGGAAGRWQGGAAALGVAAGLVTVTLLAKRVLRRGTSETEEALVEDQVGIE